MAAAPREFLDEVYDDIQTKSKGNLCMKPREYHIWAMFMAYCLHRCSIADVYITETKYPAKIGDIGEVRKNTNILWVILSLMVLHHNIGQHGTYADCAFQLIGKDVPFVG